MAKLKQPKTYKEQIDILKAHNMIINDDVEAKETLKKVGYYRLSGYALQYRVEESDSTYRKGTEFSSIVQIYKFDEELRQLLRQYIELVEVYLRTTVSYRFSLMKCIDLPHNQHYDEKNYYRKDRFKEILQGFNRETNNYYKDSLIVKHHNEKYGGEMPMWAMTELLSFSKLSMLYSTMYISEQTAIASDIGVGPDTLKNHFHCLSVLRNKCAHAARLYNTLFNPPVHFSSAFLKKYSEIRIDSLFAYIIVLLKRLPDKSARVMCCEDLEKLLEKYKEEIDLTLIGVPSNYQNIMNNNIR